MTNEYLLPYIAGFFDGEGSIGLYRTRTKDKIGVQLRTQLCQNVTNASINLFSVLQKTYGGNVSEVISLSGRKKYNWQLNADLAVAFLSDIEPYLHEKKAQAKLAILWQKQRPPLVRDSRGRICRLTPESAELNLAVMELVKTLKKVDIVGLSDILESESDLEKIIQMLRDSQVV